MKSVRICHFLLLCIASPVGRAAEEQITHPAELALELTTRMAGDTDVKLDTLLRVVESAVKADRFDVAEQALKQMDDSRRVVATVAMVRALAARGADHAELRKELESTKAFVTRGNGLAADRARMEMALGLAVCGGDASTIEDWMNQIVDKETALAARLRELIADAETKYDHQAALELVLEGAKSGPFPAAVTAGGELLALAFKRHDEAQSQEEVAAAVKLGLQALELPKNANVDATSLRFDGAVKLFRAGAEEESRLVFEKAMTGLNGMPNGYELKALLHAKWAELWVARGKKEEALKIVEKGRRLANAHLVEMHRPGVLAPLASAAALAGNQQLFEDILDEALVVAAGNPNPRVRLLAGVNICLSFLSSGDTLTHDLLARLRALDSSSSAESGS